MIFAADALRSRRTAGMRILSFVNAIVTIIVGNELVAVLVQRGTFPAAQTNGTTRMMISKGAACAAAIAEIVLGLQAGMALAEDRPLVWNVTKSGGRDFAFRSGVALDSSGRPSFGVESNMTVASAELPGTSVAPVRLWGEVSLASAESNTSILRGGFDARIGKGSIGLDQTRSSVPMGSLDLTTTRSLKADGLGEGVTNLVALQSVTLSFANLDAAVVAAASVETVGNNAVSLALRKSLASGASVSASVKGVSGGAEATFRARLARKW